MPVEGLATLRARRANAGSKLKQLIAMEDDVSQTNRFVADEDDDVALLFAEDENDGEFRSSSAESDLGNEDDENEGDSDDAGNKDDAQDASEPAEPRKRQASDDDMLSSSDISGSDTDESEGEKELEKQERLKKRQQRKKKSVVPAIKKLKPTPVKQAPKKQVPMSESLMRSQRSSSRASAIESKQALVQKLKEDEERRASMAPVVRPKYVELTQEERLAEAVETEIINTRSLNEFMDQELKKKEAQRQLLLLRRKRLRNIIRLISQESFVSPTEEVEEARYVHDYINGRLKKKPGRKRKEIEEQRERLPGDIDTDLPYYRREMWEKRLKLEADLRKKAEKYDTNKTETTSAPASENGDKLVEVSSENQKESDHNGEHANGETVGQSKESKNDSVGPQEKSAPAQDSSAVKQESETIPETKPNDNEETNGPKEASSEPSTKQVKFADTELAPTDDKEETPEDGTVVFEGPVQRIARNMVYFLELDEKIDGVKLKSYLLGEQSLLPASRRYRDLETIVRIGQAVNPYAVVKDEKDDLLELAADLTEEDPRFDDLKKLPKLGITEMIYEDDEDEKEVETAEIVLNTEAPSGLYLPNGNKKACLISGTEVRYFDPALGVPYSTVEVYKFLKQMETGIIPWYSIERDYNDYGPAEIYLSARDGSARHAKGVPEGFDG